jgi:hypothetical protein
MIVALDVAHSLRVVTNLVNRVSFKLMWIRMSRGPQNRGLGFGKRNLTKGSRTECRLNTGTKEIATGTIAHK